MAKEKMGLIVVGYHSEAVWPAFWESLSRSERLPDYVVVAENSPVAPDLDGSDLPFPLEIVHLPDNPGYGAAANAAWERLPRSLSSVVVCNPDTVCEPTTLARLEQVLLSHENAGVVGPAILNTDGSVYPSARAFPGVRVGVGHALFADVWKSNPWTKRYLGRYEGPDTRVVDWLSGAFMMFRREAWESVGGFDPGYFMFLEDVDICYRLKRQGWRSVYVPTASITHSGAHATKLRMRQMVTIHHASARRFLARLYDKPVHAPLRALLRCGLAIRAVLAARRYRDGSPG